MSLFKVSVLDLCHPKRTVWKALLWLSVSGSSSYRLLFLLLDFLQLPSLSLPDVAVPTGVFRTAHPVCTSLLSPAHHFKVCVIFLTWSVDPTSLGWKSGDPLLDLIYLRSFPSPWWAWAFLPFFIDLIVGWDFASVPAVLWWGSWYLVSCVFPPESSFFYLVSRWTTIPASSPAFPSLSRLFWNFIGVASAGTSVHCHWNREPNLLGTW